MALNRIYDLGVNSHRNFNTKYAYFLGMVTDIRSRERIRPSEGKRP